MAGIRLVINLGPAGTLVLDQTRQLAKATANDRLARPVARSLLPPQATRRRWSATHDHGLFAYEVLDALYSDGDNSGTVELNELAAYVYAEVSQLRKSSGNAKSPR